MNDLNKLRNTHYKETTKGIRLQRVGLLILFADFIFIAYYTVSVEWVTVPTLVGESILAILLLIVGSYLLFMAKIVQKDADQVFLQSYIDLRQTED